MNDRVSHPTGASTWVVGWTVILLVLLPAGVAAAVEPPEPSYQGRWMTSGSSPFFNLRNEVEKPQPPDTPAQPETTEDSPAKPPDAESEANRQESTDRPQDSPAESTEKPDMKTRDQTTKTRVQTETRSRGDTPESEPKTPEEPSAPSAAHRPKPGPLKPLDPQPALFGTFAAVTRDTVPVALPRGWTLSGDTGGFRVMGARPETDRDPFRGILRRWGGWIALALLGISAVLLGWGVRSRRVRVIQSSPSGLPLSQDGPDRGARARDPESLESLANPSGSASNRSVPAPIWDWEDTILEDRGIDPRYRPVLEMYYSENKPREEIVQTTEFDQGEIGLVLDMADRLEEEQNYGTGA